MLEVGPEWRRKKGWINLRISAIVDEAVDTKTLIFEDADDGGRSFDYWAGQYLTFRFDEIAPKPIVRSYTMSSSPCQDKFIAVTVKKVPDGFISHYLCDQTRPGQILRARGPIGKFCYDPSLDAPHLFMLGAGSGVTPFVSILREYAPRLGKVGAPAKMTLFAVFRSLSDRICWETLEACSQYEGVKVVTTLSRENVPGYLYGRPNDVLFEKVISRDYEATTFMTCGPEIMMENFVQHLKERNVSQERIKLESFA